MVLTAVYHVVFMMVLFLFVSYFHLPKTLHYHSLYIFPQFISSLKVGAFLLMYL